MALDSLSRHGIIVGMVTSLIEIQIALYDIHLMDNKFAGTQYEIKVIGFTVFLILLSILMIIGIIKKRILLMQPWILATTAISIYADFMLIYKSDFGLMIFMVVFAIELLLLHPIYSLSWEIRKLTTAALKAENGIKLVKVPLRAI